METSPRVLIVGAGPTGLLIACELARFGIPIRIIDRAPARSAHSKALGVQARTLEILDQAGVADELIARGIRIEKALLAVGDDRPQTIELDDIPSRYPFLLSVPQAITEEVLEKKLESLGGKVERGTELVLIQEKAGGVVAAMRTAGDEELKEFAWIVACDGAHSTIRDSLDVEFEGTKLKEEFILADGQVTVPFEERVPFIRLGPHGPFVLIPLPNGEWRVIAQIPESKHRGTTEDAAPGEVQAIIEDRRREPIKIGDISWASRFSIHSRIIPDLRKGRVFFAGDAAHIHSPVGGQGMNLGLQDAHNLAWKLALVVRSRAAAAILDSYDDERRPIAKSVIDWTTRATNIVTTPNSALQGVRDFAVKMLAKTETVQRHLAGLISETGCAYPDSNITGKVDCKWMGLDAGDYAGNIKYRDGTSEEEKPLADLVTDLRHLILLEGTDESCADLATQLHDHFDDILQAVIVNPPKAPPGGIKAIRINHEAAEDAGIAIIRPDVYIGVAARQASAETVERFLQKCGLMTEKRLA